VVGLKVARAEDHMDWLKTKIRAYEKGKPYSIIEERKAETETHVTIKLIRDVPLELAVVVGEILHDLRSALDHIACYLADSDCHDGTGFPIYRTAKGFSDASLGKLRGVANTAITAIEGLQPYMTQGPVDEHPLRVLHELNRIEKHRVPQLAANFLQMNVGPRSSRFRLEDDLTITIQLQHEAIRRSVFRRQPNMRDAFTIEITFAQPGVAHDRPVVATLTEIGQHMERVVLPKLNPFLG
jgi:hypothetical protein